MKTGVLTLKNGGFWRDGVEEPIVLGDAEQIALMKAAERKIEEGIDIDVSVKVIKVDVSYTFDCPFCQRQVEDSYTDYPNESPSDLDEDSYGWLEDIDGDVMTCSCGRRYMVTDGKAQIINE